MTHSLRTKSAINRFQYSIENPFPIAKTADVFRAILLLLTPLLFTACAGIDPKTYHPPKRKSSLVLSDELRWKAMARIGLFGYTYALPQGTYPAILEDRNGLYYKSPTEDGIFQYYADVIDDVADDDLQVYLYHIPQMSIRHGFPKSADNLGNHELTLMKTGRFVTRRWKVSSTACRKPPEYFALQFDSRSSVFIRVLTFPDFAYAPI